jgi:HK97 family phage major capsid protein
LFPSHDHGGNEEIPLNKLSVYSIVTNELLMDSEFNVASEVQMDVAEDFAQLEGAGFINGVAANNEPEGILTNSSIQQVETKVAGQIDLDTFINTQGELKSGYDGSWMMNRRTIAKVRLLKDGQGQYLWNPDNTAGQPLTLLGDTVISAIDVPDVASGALAVIYGDYRRGYIIVDRTTMTMIRDNVTLADFDQTKFTFHRRVAGHVRQAEAMKIIKIKA